MLSRRGPMSMMPSMLISVSSKINISIYKGGVDSAGKCGCSVADGVEKRRVPKGTSSYQAAWIVDDEEGEEDGEGGERDESGEDMEDDGDDDEEEESDDEVSH